MGHRSRLEDRYTVRCKHCGHERIDASHPRRRWLRGTCPKCGARFDGRTLTLAPSEQGGRDEGAGAGGGP